ncbi:unnamed protein product [Orchesella dallaii]|uniref:DDE Tnp4 domain-containing protein n=1 Tax=Orchesella dallaii TaxID=48710 RepID=A0ABP1Q5Y9_9HEXA
MAMESTETDTMEAVLDLSPEEARTYSMILDAASTLPKNDPRFALTLTFTWWLLHRRRRLEQQRVRRRQFFRRMRRLIFLRWHMQRNTLSGVVAASGENDMAEQDELSVVPEKRLWVRKDRNDDFWTKIDQNLINPGAFRKYFHMSRETFDYVYDELAEQLQKSNTSMRDSLPGKKRLAATIYRMATNAEYIKVANLFGIGKSTTTSLVRDVCEVIVANLKDKFLTFAGEGTSKEEMRKRVEDSAQILGIPRVIGVLGSIDVLIIGSSWDWSENSPYISSYHKSYAVIFQAVVDAEGRFSHVSAGSPSSLTNKQALEQCGLQEEFLQKFAPDADEEVMPARLVADESFSTSKPSANGGDENEKSSEEINDAIKSQWILTSEDVDKESQDENERQLMEEKIIQVRSVFDDAVLRAKSRWKIFHGKSGKINFSADAFEKIALACCILHNICEIQGDEIDPNWGSDIGPEVFNRDGYPKETPAAMSMEVEDENEDFHDIADMEGDQDASLPASVLSTDEDVMKEFL